LPITSPPARNWSEDRIEVAFAGGVQDVEFQPEAAGRRLQGV